ncbi:hypothetical protein ACA910_011721 [Epithemia clementina (nom. ined.)]
MKTIFKVTIILALLEIYTIRNSAVCVKSVAEVFEPQPTLSTNKAKEENNNSHKRMMTFWTRFINPESNNSNSNSNNNNNNNNKSSGASMNQSGKQFVNRNIVNRIAAIHEHLSHEAKELATRRQEEWEQGIQRIYYINLDKNVKRKESMESSLSNVQPRVPFKRFPAMTGTLNVSSCHPKKRDPARCRGLTGLSRTVIKLMDTENMTGISLVLEDDFDIASNLTIIQQAIDLVPGDWDIIRFPVWLHYGMPQNPGAYHKVELDKGALAMVDPDLKFIEIYRVQLPEMAPPGRDNYVCAGTESMVWRESSLYKLHRAWSRRPYNDIDCCLAQEPGLKSYVITFPDKEQHLRLFGKIRVIADEFTDIPGNQDLKLLEKAKQQEISN